MGIISLASGASAYRGYQYYKDKKVIAVRAADENLYEGDVNGSNGARYHVTIDMAHPRFSKCNCPKANGRRVICKHIVAAYFKLFPQEAKQYLADLNQAEVDARQQAKNDRLMVQRYVKKMKRSDLENAFLMHLEESPEWVYDRFVRFVARQTGAW